MARKHSNCNGGFLRSKSLSVWECSVHSWRRKSRNPLSFPLTAVAHAPSPSSPLSPSFVHHMFTYFFHFVLFSLEKRSQRPRPSRGTMRPAKRATEQRTEVGRGFSLSKRRQRGGGGIWANAMEEANCGKIGYMDDARLRLCQGSMRPTLLVCIQNRRCSARTFGRTCVRPGRVGMYRPKTSEGVGAVRRQIEPGR